MTRARRHAALLLAGFLAVFAASAACTQGGGVSSPTLSRPSSPAVSAPPTSTAPAPSPDAGASPAPSEPSEPPSEPPSVPPAEPTRWSLLDLADGPGAREDHTWTVEPGARAAWLFGGRDGPDSFGDLWRLDLATDTWERMEPAATNPDARFGHTATWVDGVGLVVWSGQANATTFFDDIWAFDPAAGTWRELAAPGARPPSRYGSCAALGPDGRLWVSHGFTADAGRFADTWAYDFAAGRWFEEIPSGELPVVRCLHDCLWTPDGRLVLYAGQTTGVPAIGDLWTRSVDGPWEQQPDGAAPAARQLYALAVRGETGWVFGGGGEDRSKLDDLWALDLSTLSWREVRLDGERPSGLAGATLITDPGGERLLLFGGLNEERASAETWALSFDG